MSINDFRELCAELVNELEKWCGTYDGTTNSQSVFDRAHAALVEQPEPERSTDEEPLHVAAISIEPYEKRKRYSLFHKTETLSIRHFCTPITIRSFLSDLLSFLREIVIFLVGVSALAAFIALFAQLT